MMNVQLVAKLDLPLDMYKEAQNVRRAVVVEVEQDRDHRGGVYLWVEDNDGELVADEFELETDKPKAVQEAYSILKRWRDWY
jgi:hypothetical protein